MIPRKIIINNTVTFKAKDIFLNDRAINLFFSENRSANANEIIIIDNKIPVTWRYLLSIYKINQNANKPRAIEITACLFDISFLSNFRSIIHHYMRYPVSERFNSLATIF